MKCLSQIAILMSLFAGSNSLATQYEVFVSSAVHVAANQMMLNTLNQKTILIDTDRKAVYLTLPAHCEKGLCTEALRRVALRLNQYSVAHEMLAHADATGELNLDGKIIPVSLSIALNANHATDITFTSTTDCKSMRSTFVGGPTSISNSPF